MEKSIKTQLEKGELTAGNNLSYWTDSIAPLYYKPLAKNIDADVVIVGAGNSGLSIAYTLSKSGKSVVVVEDGCIGSGETGRTSAHLTAVLDNRYFELEKLYGAEKTKLVAESHMQAIQFIETTSKVEDIDCEFHRLSAYLFLHPTDKPESLQKEYKAATEAGLNVIFHEQVPYVRNEEGPCLEFTNQAKYHPLKYIHGLAAAIIKNGANIFTETHAEEIDDKGITTSDGFRVNAKHIIVTTNSPVNNKYLMHLRQYAYRTYITGLLVDKNSIVDALYWDTGEQSEATSFAAYHYVRIQSYNDKCDLLICGGEDHPTGLIEATDKTVEEERYRALESWARNHFPVKELIYEWSGQVLYAFDALGYIGRNPLDKDNIYIVTGDNGNGLTYGAIAAILIPDLIDGNENEFEDLYRPSRFNFLKAGKVFIEEVVSGLKNYYKTKSKPEDSIDDIPVGEGRIIEIEGKKYGAFRGFDEHIHIVASECTHLGCIVKWNNDEKSWDCPCHGSRFTNTGNVINGPANTNLNYHKVPANEHEILKSTLK